MDDAPLIDTATRIERRRPGRPERVSSALLPLLRAEERALLPPLVDDAPAEDRRLLDAGQGVTLGVLIGSGLWAAIIAAGGALLDAF